MTKQRKRFCFYCNDYSVTTATPNRTGSSFEWTCPLCDAINTVDSAGEILDTVPESTYDDFASSNPAKDNNDDSPFCLNCRTNHRIVMEALANYVAPRDDYDSDIYGQKLQLYKADLERRFPPVCENCEVKVFGQLSQNNYTAKSRILGEMLNGSREARSSFRSTQADTFGVAGDGQFLKQRWTAKKLLKVLFWMIRGSLWLFQNLVFVGVLTTNALLPEQQNRKMALFYSYDMSLWQIISDVYFCANRLVTSSHFGSVADHSDCLCLLFKLLSFSRLWSILYLYWNYQLLPAMTSSKKVTVIGKSEYYRCQTILYLQMLFSVYLIPKMYLWSFSDKAFQLVNVLLATTACLNILTSLLCLKIVEVRYTRYSENTVMNCTANLPSVAQQTPERSYSTPAGVFDLAQLGDKDAFQETESRATEVLHAAVDSDQMDWTPSFAPQGSMTTAVPDKFPSIPKLPSGYVLPPPPTGARTGFNLTSTNNGNSNVQVSKPEQYFKHTMQTNKEQNIPMSGLKEENSRVLAPQRFFPSETPTGLEDLFDPVLKLSDKQEGHKKQIAHSPQRGLLGVSAVQEPANRISGWIAASVIVTGVLAVVLYILYSKFWLALRFIIEDI
ncbi:Ima1 N-terminal domain-containing protein [Lipomyces arxii]|uniref:Ima1 N-terminal domain-containing protein n=1 Tax=Lipomyces arxii TaxID=56418 RepID=UPI0034CDD547